MILLCALFFSFNFSVCFIIVYFCCFVFVLYDFKLSTIIGSGILKAFLHYSFLIFFCLKHF